MPAFLSDNFLDFHPACSRLLIELTRDFLGGLSEDEVTAYEEKHVKALMHQGYERQFAEMAWRIIIQDRRASEPISPRITAKHAFNEATASQHERTETGNFQETFSRPSAENVFSFERGRWVVSYRGKTIYPQDISGIKYLHYLISHPGQTFSPKELYDGFGERKQKSNPSLLTVAEALNTGVAFASAQSDVMVDQQGKQEMLARLEQIEIEMADAKLIPDADLIEKLASERLQITEELRKAFTPVGSRRIREPDLVRRMKAVDIAIRRAKEKIQRAGHHELFRHLCDTVEVKVKSGCRYSPNSTGPWRTEADSFQAPLQPR